MRNKMQFMDRPFTQTGSSNTTVCDKDDSEQGSTRIDCRQSLLHPRVRQAWSFAAVGVVALVLGLVVGVGQVIAENGFAPAPGLANPAARLQIAAASSTHDPHAHHKVMKHQNDFSAQQEDPHAHHRHMMKQKTYQRSTHEYVIPELELVDKDNNKVSLDQALATDEPVMLNFIFTTCTTICPVLSATFAQVQRELGDEAGQVKMISISIDPEYDTPERLRDYADRFKAGPQWQFYTGSNDNIIAAQKVFDAYRGGKNNHEPLTFLHVPENPQWVRVNGLASAADVVKEYRQLLAE